jgi:quercetin dioxygenase-like cupin family protein
MGVKIIDSSKIKEEQIWGPNILFFDRKVYRSEKFDVTFRKVEAGKYKDTEYVLHDHGDSTEVVFFLEGKLKEFFETEGIREVKKGDLLIVEPHTKHGLVEVEEDSIQVVFYVPGLKIGRH